jgi:hypothetical protein
MSPAELQSYIKETPSPMARQIAEKVLRDKVGKAGGGIIAFANPDEKNNQGVVKDEEDLTLPSSYDKTKKILPELKEPGQNRREFREALTNFKMPNLSSYEKGIKAAKQPAPEAPASELVELSASTPQNTAPAPAPAPAEPRVAPATTGSGTGIKAVPSDKIMPTAGIKLPDTDSIDVSKIREKALAEKEAYMGPNIAAQQEKARLMAEKSNARDEASRISSMRMAEFFAAWGSTPGNTIVAGLTTLRNKIPDFVSDQKEETRIRKAIDKDIVELEKIDRLEKSSNYDAATNTAEKLKSELSKNALQKYGYDIKALSDANQTAATLKAAEIRGPGGSGGEGKAGTLYNQAVTRFQTETKNVEAAKKEDKEYRRALIKLTSDPKNTEALAVKNAKEAGWNARLKERQDDVDYYKNKQGREARVSGDSVETKTPGNDPLNIRKP